MLTHILPQELIEKIILQLDPLDVAVTAQTSRFLRSLVYNAQDDHLWRSLYLKQPFDDPRKCVNLLGVPRSHIDWKSELQQIIRARTVMRRCSLVPDSISSATRPPGERRVVLQTLWRLASNIPLAPVAFSDVADNLVWVTWLLRSSNYLSEPAHPLDQQMQEKLHAHLGLVQADLHAAKLLEARVYCYDFRHYTLSPEIIGPYLPGGRVNWLHIRALQHIISMRISRGNKEFLLNNFPLSLPFCQAVLAGADEPLEDWVGISSGPWSLVQCHGNSWQMDGQSSCILVQFIY